MMSYADIEPHWLAIRDWGALHLLPLVAVAISISVGLLAVS